MIYVIEGLEIDDRQLEVRGADGVIAVEPRVLDALIYLIQHRDRVVAKDELLEHVWQSEHVSDGAISRCIMEARRAVGDDGQGRLIKTVHGRGYRFISDVEERDGHGPATAGPSTVYQSESKVSSRRTLAFVAVLMASIAAIFWWMDQRRSEPVAPGNPQVVLVPTMTGTDSDGLWLGKSLEDSLRLSLAGVSGIELETVEVGVEGIEAHVAGQEQRAVVTVGLEPADIEGFVRFEVAVTRGLATGATERTPLGVLILPKLGPANRPDSFESIRAAVVGTVVPRLMATLDPERFADSARREAWQLYLRALTQWEPMCEAGAAEDLLIRSLELEAAFEPAWTMLAYLRLTQAKFCAGMTTSLADIDTTVERMIELAPESSTPFAFQATVLLYRGEVEAAWALLTEAEERFGDDLALRLGRSTVARYAGFLDESRRLFDGVVEDLPALPYVAGFVPYPYRYQGDWVGFLGLMTGQESPHYRFYRGLAEHMLGNDEAAISALEPAFALHPGDLYGRLCEALLAILRGDLDEARVLLIQLGRQRSGGEGLDPEVTFEIAHVMLLAGEVSSGLEQLTLAVEQGFFCAPCIEGDAAFDPLVGRQEFDDLLQRARDRQRRFGERFGLS